MAAGPAASPPPWPSQACTGVPGCLPAGGATRRAVGWHQCSLGLPAGQTVTAIQTSLGRERGGGARA